jgi:tRNA A-37 threonylcarbamoyl transferase component Bud32/tetratricopeptide (TPR) repeat protein
MTPERWQRIKVILEELEGVPAEDCGKRADFLCGGDAELRREVGEFLTESDAAEFLQDVVGDAAVLVREAAAGELTVERRVGNYRILRRVGKGGQGSVFEAVRDDGAFQQRVAIKLIQWELETDATRERFRQERQILAGLEHPYIARLLDGGETPEGTPYLVMEFVDGLPLNQAAAEWPLRRKLELFLKICSAIEEAHRQLVIHRDLKPANILVTAAGDPKLLDFGIAKLVEGGAGKTRTAFAAMTPDYASPEQVRGQSVSTASDVYSLGVVLYQLLTGRKPYHLETATAVEMDRAICETEPPSPKLGDELDDIILTALRKEPSRRYGTVQSFAEDVTRYLNHEPVRARPDTFRYRARKFARRNWVGVIAASVALGGILAGSGVAVYQARIAQQRFQQVRHLANTFLFDFHDAIADLPGSTKARLLIVKTALEYLDNLSKSAGRDASLQAEVANAYERVAVVQGQPRAANLGDTAGAAASYRKAAELYESIAKGNAKYKLDAARARNRLAFVEANINQFAQARDDSRRAFEIASSLPTQNNAEVLNLLISLNDVAGEIAQFSGGLAAAGPYVKKAASLREEWAHTVPPPDPITVAVESSLTHQRVGRWMMSTGSLTEAAKELELSLDYFKRAALLDPLNARYQRNYMGALSGLAALYGADWVPNLQEYEKGIPLARSAAELAERLLAADPNNLDMASLHSGFLLMLAYDLWKTNPQQGAEEARKGVGEWRKLIAGGKMAQRDREMAINGVRLAIPIAGSSLHSREGLALAREVVAEGRRIVVGVPPQDDQNWFLSEVLVADANEALAMGETAEAKRMLDEAIAVTKPFIGEADKVEETAMPAANLYASLEHFHAAAGDCAAARTWRNRAVEMWRKLAANHEYSRLRSDRLNAIRFTCNAGR